MSRIFRFFYFCWNGVWILSSIFGVQKNNGTTQFNPKRPLHRNIDTAQKTTQYFQKMQPREGHPIMSRILEFFIFVGMGLDSKQYFWCAKKIRGRHNSIQSDHYTEISIQPKRPHNISKKVAERRTLNHV